MVRQVGGQLGELGRERPLDGVRPADERVVAEIVGRRRGPVHVDEHRREVVGAVRAELVARVAQRRRRRRRRHFVRLFRCARRLT